MRVDRRGIWLETSVGERVDPQEVRGPDGVLVGLDFVSPEDGVARASFALSDLAHRPWTLRVLPRAAPAWEVVLAEVERGPLGFPADLFGYQRETWFHPDGTTHFVYARETPGGERIEVGRRAFEDRVEPSLGRACAALSSLARFASCPELAHVVATGLERGAEYRGTVEGDNTHPHARGTLFWSRPRRLQDTGHAPDATGQEDPVDTLVWFLVELFNAESADAYRAIWDGVLDGSLSEQQYLERETLQKAAQVRRAVETVEGLDGCLGLSRWRAGGAVVFTEYERWVRASGGDLRRLARIILRNPARYGSRSAEAGLTYGERLRGLYREHAPVVGAGVGERGASRASGL